MIPTKRIDYIYTSNQFEVVDSNVLDKKFYHHWPSDHAALITELKLKDPLTAVIASPNIIKKSKKKVKKAKNEVVKK